MSVVTVLYSASKQWCPHAPTPIDPNNRESCGGDALCAIEVAMDSE